MGRQPHIADLRTRLFAHLLNLSAGFYTENSTGQLISRVMNDTAVAAKHFKQRHFRHRARPGHARSARWRFCFWQQPKLTLISMIVLPVCIIPIAIFSRKVRRSSREMQTQSAELTQIMTESFTGHRVVKAYNLENIAAEKFRDTARKSVGHYMRIIRAMEIPGPLIEFFGACGVALLLAYLDLRSSDRGQAPPIFCNCHFSIFAMYQPMKNLTRLQNQIVQARAASERVFELLATKNSVPEPAQPRLLHAANADIQFDHVEFCLWRKNRAARTSICTIKSGQLVALVGASGSGKTTLSNLLLRFYDPLRGAIKIGGVDIREFTTRDLRNQIAVVTQENILFNDTIRRNIELGRPGATNEEIIAAAKHAHAHEFILEKPEGYETRHRRKRRDAFRRPAPAPRHRPRRFAQRADFDSGRSHQRARHRIRTRRAGRARRIDARPHDLLHRAPALDHFARRLDCRAGSRPHRRNRHARRTGQARAAFIKNFTNSSFANKLTPTLFQND